MFPIYLLAWAWALVDQPPCMTAFESARKSAIISGRVQWSVTPEGDPARQINFVSRYARNGDMIFENRGDAEGWTMRAPGGRGLSRYPQLYMRTSDRYWHSQETGLRATVATDSSSNKWGRSARDIRWLGIAPATKSLEALTGFDAIYGPQSNPEEHIVAWEERREGALYVATARFTSGARVEWQIDPDRGWNASRIRVIAVDGTIPAEAVCALKEFDGVWLPEKVEYYQAGRLHEAIAIRSARLNRNDDPDSFNAGDLFLEPGDTVVPLDGGAQPLRWNGRQTVSLQQWDADVAAGRSQWSERRQALNRGEPFSSPYDTREESGRRATVRADHQRTQVMQQHETLWRRYVEEFIQRCKLNAEQAARARQLLSACEDEANEYIGRNRVELDRAVAGTVEARSAGDKPRLEAATRRLAQLRGPIDAIFEKKLKPKLDTIPTRAQRQAAESNAVGKQERP